MLIDVMKFLSSILFIFFYLTSYSYSDINFNKWLINYKEYAVKQGISKKTVDEAFKNTKLLKRIIKYESLQRIKEKKEEDCIILKKAINNYIKFYGNSRPFPTRKVLKNSSAGIKGWAEANI